MFEVPFFRPFSFLWYSCPSLSQEQEPHDPQKRKLSVAENPWQNIKRRRLLQDPDHLFKKSSFSAVSSSDEGEPSGHIPTPWAPSQRRGSLRGGPINTQPQNKHPSGDLDPLVVQPKISFTEVGGLDDHIDSLKEMVILPLLYPEVTPFLLFLYYYYLF